MKTNGGKGHAALIVTEKNRVEQCSEALEQLRIVVSTLILIVGKAITEDVSGANMKILTALGEVGNGEQISIKKFLIDSSLVRVGWHFGGDVMNSGEQVNGEETTKMMVRVKTCKTGGPLDVGAMFSCSGGEVVDDISQKVRNWQSEKILGELHFSVIIRPFGGELRWLVA